MKSWLLSPSPLGSPSDRDPSCSRGERRPGSRQPQNSPRAWRRGGERRRGVGGSKWDLGGDRGQEPGCVELASGAPCPSVFTQLPRRRPSPATHSPAQSLGGQCCPLPARPPPLEGLPSSWLPEKPQTSASPSPLFSDDCPPPQTDRIHFTTTQPLRKVSGKVYRRCGRLVLLSRGRMRSVSGWDCGDWTREGRAGGEAVPDSRAGPGRARVPRARPPGCADPLAHLPVRGDRTMDQERPPGCQAGSHLPGLGVRHQVSHPGARRIPKGVSFVRSEAGVCSGRR